MNILCLVLDRLHIGYLGAFGNTWIDTPALDRLAFEGAVFDQAWVATPNLDRFFDGLWLGRGPIEPRLGETAGLPALAAAAGFDSVLATDDPAVIQHPLASGFDELIEFQHPRAERPAESVEETHLVDCFARLIERIEDSQRPFYLTCHLGSLGAVWDAPLEFRMAYVDDDDPRPPLAADPPNRMLPPEFDPDEILGMSQNYAGQVSLLDTCLAALRESLESSAVGRDTLLAIVAPRGFPLGEHRRLGPCDEALYSELVHVPLLLRFPDRRAAAIRSQALVTPSDLAATLAELLGIEGLAGSPASRSLVPLIEGRQDAIRDRLAIWGYDGERGLLTPAWYLRTAARPGLFVRPDDFWQVNDVADRCPSVVEGMLEALSRVEAAAAVGQADEVPLTDELLYHPD